MKRLFKSTEDYTKPVVQIEILHIDDKLYQRNWTKIMVQGKARKAKRGWKLMDIKPSQLKLQVIATENYIKSRTMGGFYTQPQ